MPVDLGKHVGGTVTRVADDDPPFLVNKYFVIIWYKNGTAEYVRTFELYTDRTRAVAGRIAGDGQRLADIRHLSTLRTKPSYDIIPERIWPKSPDYYEDWLYEVPVKGLDDNLGANGLSDAQVIAAIEGAMPRTRPPPAPPSAPQKRQRTRAFIDHVTARR